MLAALLALAWAAPGLAQSPVSVTATLDRTSATLGDAVELKLSVSAPPGTVTTIRNLGPALEAAGLEPLAAPVTLELGAIASATSRKTTGVAPAPEPDEVHTSRPAEEELTVLRWKLAAFRLGEVAVEGVEVAYWLAGQSEGKAPVPRLELRVSPASLPAGISPPQDGLFGVKAPVTLRQEPAERWLLATAIALAGLMIALAIWRPDLLKRLFGRGAAPEPPPPPPDVEALDALARLIGEGHLARGEAREYFGRLSAILRRYLDRRFDLHSREATTDELAPVLRRHETLGRTWYERLRKFLVTCDLAKFAKHVPPRAVTEELTDLVRAFVLQTRVAPGDELPPSYGPAGPPRSAGEVTE